MELTCEGCRQRQQRLLGLLAQAGLDGAVVGRREHVLYFTGFLHSGHHAAAAWIGADGRVVLVAAGAPNDVAADKVVGYAAAHRATMHNRQYEAVAETLRDVVPASRRIGADLGGAAACITTALGGQVQDIGDAITCLRQRKLPDEVEAIRAAIGITEVMYQAAREVVAPGADEVDVLAHVRAAATRAAGEDLEHFGNDYQANSPGGPARRRAMQAGELYILDAGPSLHGYFADNCRTFSIDGRPTDEQLRAWHHIDALFPRLEAAARPGVRAADLFDVAHEHLSSGGYAGLVHHLGHGIGLAPHEAPQLNPDYDAVLAVGDVFTMEPGLYAPELKAGIRLEENYLLTDSGVERLTRFPRALA